MAGVCQLNLFVIVTLQVRLRQIDNIETELANRKKYARAHANDAATADSDSDDERPHGQRLQCAQQ